MLIIIGIMIIYVFILSNFKTWNVKRNCQKFEVQDENRWPLLSKYSVGVSFELVYIYTNSKEYMRNILLIGMFIKFAGVTEQFKIKLIMPLNLLGKFVLL